MSAEKPENGEKTGETNGEKFCKKDDAKNGFKDLLADESEYEDDDEDDDEDEYEDDEDDDDEYGYEVDIETEIEHQTPEVIAKELLITYLESNPLGYPEAGPGENKYRAVGRAIGEMYNGLLEEIRKTSA